MRSMHRFPTSALVAVSLLAGPALAAAQPAVPTPPPPAAPAGGDPPARVGRLAQIVGPVSFHLPGAEHWDAATLNYPVTAGNAFWTEPNARASVEFGGARTILAPSTELDIDTLDEHTVSTTVPQGEVCVMVQSLAAGQSMDVRTPRGVVTIAAPGRYGIVAGDTDHPTAVTVLEGAAQVNGAGADFQLAAGQTGVVTGTDTYQSKTVAAQPDPFLAAQCVPPPPPAHRVSSAVPPPAVAMMVGSDDLAQYGAWQQTPEYGAVWYPQVATDWVPYRHGRWAYVEPWGWTWVDQEPWGFAPFHYGRWAEFGGRWGWVPAAYAAPDPRPPVYAPALVSFVEPGAAIAAGIAAGALAGAAVGWLPLGPHEPYRPWYHASDTYLRAMNVRYIAPGGPPPGAPPPMTGFVNRGAATVVPAAVMAASRPVAPAARPIPTAQFANVRPVAGAMSLAPTAATIGMTHGLATRMNLAPVPAAEARRPAAGPAFAERTDPRAPVPLRSTAPVAAAPAAGPPHGGLPPLMTPGERGHQPPAQVGAPGPAPAPHMTGPGGPAAPPRPAEPLHTERAVPPPAMPHPSPGPVAPRAPSPPHVASVAPHFAAPAPRPERPSPEMRVQQPRPPATRAPEMRPPGPPREMRQPAVHPQEARQAPPPGQHPAGHPAERRREERP